ncbi:MAG: hypothetical protein WCX95_00390 [Candidatus Gracilibacteria bacterium]
MLRPSTNPEEQRFLRSLELRDAPLFADIMGIIEETRQRISKVSTVENTRTILQESENKIRALYSKYKDSSNHLFGADIQKADSIVLRMVLEKFAQIASRAKIRRKFAKA